MEPHIDKVLESLLKLWNFFVKSHMHSSNHSAAPSTNAKERIGHLQGYIAFSQPYGGPFASA
eukprot:1117903-Pelagomonas_calceolata.AAC.1